MGNACSGKTGKDTAFLIESPPGSGEYLSIKGKTDTSGSIDQTMADFSSDDDGGWTKECVVRRQMSGDFEGFVIAGDPAYETIMDDVFALGGNAKFKYKPADGKIYSGKCNFPSISWTGPFDDACKVTFSWTSSGPVVRGNAP